jgi:hypothetical protein
MNPDDLAFDGIAEGAKNPEFVSTPADEQELVGRIKDLFLKAYNNRQQYAADWAFFRAYLKGDQLVVRHRDTGETIRLSARDQRKLKSINNFLRPTARALVGKLTRAIPTIDVVPATSDIEEFHAARTADSYLQYFRAKEALDVKYVDACEYLPWAGNSFLYLHWDPMKGDDLVVCGVCDFYNDDMNLIGEMCPKCTMQREQELMQFEMETEQFQMQVQQQMMQMQAQGIPPELIHQQVSQNQPPSMQQMGPLDVNAEVPVLAEARSGDIAVELLDVNDFFIEPGVERLEDATYFFIRLSLPLIRVRQLYPEAAQWISSDSDIYGNDYQNEAYSAVFGTVGGADKDTEQAHVYVYHEIPTSKFPNGRIIHIINDKIARIDTESPYYKLFGRHNVFHFGFDKNANEFYREPPLAHAWHRQKEMNENETAIREHLVLLLKPKLFNPIGSKVSADELTATTGQVITYNAALPAPQFAQVPPVPADIFNRNEMIKQDIRTMFGVTEHELGISPADPNGRAMAILEAEADQILGPIIRRNNHEWRELHRCVLIMAQKFLPEDKLFTIAGPDGHQTYSFKAVKMLKKGWDLRLEEEDGMSRNKAVRKTEALDLANIGFFVDPGTGMLDRKAFARAAGLKNADRGYDYEATERARASELPYIFERGQTWTPQLVDIPQIWKDELEGWLRGPGRRSDPYVYQEVMRAWQFYTAWAMTGMLPPGVGQPQAGAPPPMPADQTAPGGTPNNPGHLASGMAPGGSTADTITSQADSYGEQMSRGSVDHEG